MNSCKLHKRIVAFLLSTFMIISCFLVFAEEDKNVTEAVYVLSSLEIIEGYENGDFALDKTITRAEFVTLAFKMMGMYDLPKDGSGSFSDVAPDHWASPYIKMASVLGIVTGYGDGTFGPEDAVTYEQAIKTLVCALGYNAQAEKLGGFPSGYWAQATKLGILKNVTVSAKDIAVRGNLFVMAYNAMNAPLLIDAGNDKYEVDKNTTLMTERLGQRDSYRMTGIVSADFFTSFAGEWNLNKGDVVIDGVVYRSGATNAEELIGQHVEFFATDFGERTKKTIVSIKPSPRYNEAVTIDNSDIVSQAGDKLSYTDENDDEKQIKLDDNVWVLYNNRKADCSVLSSDVLLGGESTFYDNDKDGVYEFVSISEYRNSMVERVDADSKLIYLKGSNVSYIDIDDDNERAEKLLIDINGEPVSIEDVKEDMGLSVFASRDGEYVKAVLLSETVNGVITEYSISDKRMVIDETEYKLNAASIGNFIRPSVIKLGQTCEAQLDIQGEIFNLDFAAANAENYAYVIGVDSNRQGLAGQTRLKLLKGGKIESVKEEKLDYGQENEDEEFIKEIKNDGIYIVELTSKPTVNGKKIKQEDAANYIKAGDVINYKTNGDGLITTVDTALNRGIYGERSFDDLSDTFGGNIGGAFRVDDHTVFFNVPSSGNDDDFYAKTEFLDGEDYYAQGFDVSDETKVASAVVVVNDISYDSYDEITNDTPITIVSQLSMLLNENDEVVYRLKGFRRNDAIDVISRSNETVMKALSGIKCGDLIRYSTDVEGKLASVNVVQYMDKDASYFVTDEYGASERRYAKVYGLELDTLLDTSTKLVDVLTVSIKGDGSDNHEYQISSKNRPSVYIYDTENKDSIKLSDMKTLRSIQGTDAEYADKVFIYATYSEIRAIVVIR